MFGYIVVLSVAMAAGLTAFFTIAKNCGEYSDMIRRVKMHTGPPTSPRARPTPLHVLDRPLSACSRVEGVLGARPHRHPFEMAPPLPLYADVVC